MVTSARRTLDALRSVGLRRAVTVGARWWLCHEYLVFVRDLHRPLPDIPPAPRVEWATVDDTALADLLAVEPHLSREEVRRRWAEDQSCVLYRVAGVPAYTFWQATGPTSLPYLGLMFRPRHGDFLVVDVFTAPAFRKHGLGRVSTIVGLHQAVKAGCRRWIALVAPWNAPALANARERAAAEMSGRVGYRRRGWHRSYFASGLVRLHPDGAMSLDDPTAARD